jgi:hypothetical protein
MNRESFLEEISKQRRIAQSSELPASVEELTPETIAAHRRVFSCIHRAEGPVNRSKVNQVAKVCAADLDAIINLLVGEGLIVAETVKPPLGRPATVYRLALP